MQINFLVACDIKNGIGLNNTIPWKLSPDLKRFRILTKNTIVIMGRKTYESLPIKPLPNRFNIVISRKAKFEASLKQNIKVFSSVSDTMDFITRLKINRVWVIGGAKIYNELLTTTKYQPEKIYLTRIYNDYNCDTFFPNINGSQYTISTYSKVFTDTPTNIRFQYIIYSKYPTPILHPETQYLRTLKQILQNGDLEDTRNGKALTFFSPPQLRFELSNNQIPFFSTRKVPIRWVFEELMWIIRGDTNTGTLNSKGVKIWNDNGSREFLDSVGLKDMPTNELGPTYGYLLRNYPSVDGSPKSYDQLENLIKNLKTNPTSRRHIISLWHPDAVNKCALPPCLYNYQFYVRKKIYLDCVATLRSSDSPIALHWNIATIAIFMRLIAKQTDLIASRMIVTLNNTHIYEPHIAEVVKFLNQNHLYFPSFPIFDILETHDNIEDYQFKDIQLYEYFPSSYKLNIKMIA